MVTLLVVFGLGFLCGWITVKRPQWATDFIAWIKMKLQTAWGS